MTTQRRAVHQSTASDLLKGGFFLLAPLLVVCQVLGVMDFVPHGVSVGGVLLLCTMFTTLVAQEWKSGQFQMVVFGLAVISVPVLVPIGSLPPAPLLVQITPIPLVLQKSGVADWGILIYLMGGFSVSLGALLYAKHLFSSLPMGVRRSPEAVLAELSSAAGVGG